MLMQLPPAQSPGTAWHSSTSATGSKRQEMSGLLTPAEHNQASNQV